MTNRTRRRTTAQETLEILERGWYTSPAGETVNIAGPLQRAIAETRHYAPGDFPDVLAARDVLLQKRLAGKTRPANATCHVRNQTTLAAARTLVGEAPGRRVICLNFASAKNPGGGFLGGSQAQEESLARASGLYATIHGVREYYDTNRACGTCLYTDHMIYSPDVPVFRDDRDLLLPAPYEVSFITSPAVNAGALAKNQPEQVDRIAATMIARIERLLALAVVHGHRTLVLGAWGCGVFKNRPDQVAGWFDDVLRSSPLRAAFDEIVFAVWDKTPNLDIIRPFEHRFGRSEHGR